MLHRLIILSESNLPSQNLGNEFPAFADFLVVPGFTSFHMFMTPSLDCKWYVVVFKRYDFADILCLPGWTVLVERVKTDSEQQCTRYVPLR